MSSVKGKKIVSNLLISSLFQKGILLWMTITIGNQLLASICFHRKILYSFLDLHQYEMNGILNKTKLNSLVNSIFTVL